MARYFYQLLFEPFTGMNSSKYPHKGVGTLSGVCLSYMKKAWGAFRWGVVQHAGGRTCLNFDIGPYHRRFSNLVSFPRWHLHQRLLCVLNLFFILRYLFSFCSVNLPPLIRWWGILRWISCCILTRAHSGIIQSFYWLGQLHSHIQPLLILPGD